MTLSVRTISPVSYKAATPNRATFGRRDYYGRPGTLERLGQTGKDVASVGFGILLFAAMFLVGGAIHLLSGGNNHSNRQKEHDCWKRNQGN